MQVQLSQKSFPTLGQQPEFMDNSISEAPCNHGEAAAQSMLVSRRAKTGGMPSLEIAVEPNESHHILSPKKEKEVEAGTAFHSLSITSIAALLNECAKQKDLQKGIEIRTSFAGRGLFQSDMFAGNSLVNMYVKCGALAEAQDAFDGLLSRNVVSWNVLIAGYTQHDSGEKALRLYEQMQKEGFSPNAFTLSSVLKACASIQNVNKGQEVHSQIVRDHFLGKNIVVANALVDMYCKCGALETAQELFDELPIRDIVSWNALITGYAQHGQGEKALLCFEHMRKGGFSPSAVTLVSLLKACSSIGSLDKGREIHEEILKLHLLEKNILVGNALVDMYAKCSELERAKEVFDKLPLLDVITWNGLITGYVEHGHGEEALKCYELMQVQGFSPDAITIICVLKACGSVEAKNVGYKIHAQVLRYGFLERDMHVGSALVDMYTKCGALKRAEEVFEELCVVDVVTWNILTAGYTDHGYCEEAFDCFERLQQSGFSPNDATFACILKACGSTGFSHWGQVMHAMLVRQGISANDTIVGTALVDMYANCGMLVDAQDVFEKLSARNVVSWSALMVGLAQLGKEEAVSHLFNNMIGDGMEPNSVTFMVILNLCSHRGLLYEGQIYFEIASKSYGVIPGVEHYTCMIDLFGRVGLLQEAVALVEEMSACGNLAMWHTLLGACQRWGDVKLGRWAFDHSIRMDECDDAVFVCMRNIYAVAGRQQDANIIEAMRVKKYGKSLDRVGGETQANFDMTIES